MRNLFESDFWWTKTLVAATLLFVLLCLSAHAERFGAAQLIVEFELPELDVDPYHRPYVAVWIETAQRQPVKTLALWTEQPDWLKDLRQWWRMIGRSNADELDGISSATRRPGRYEVVWDGLDADGQRVPPGEYLVHLEASREEGGRSFIRTKVDWPSGQTQRLDSEDEITNITVSIKEHR